MCAKYGKGIMPIMDNIKNGVTDEAVSNLLGQFSDTIISIEMQKFIKIISGETQG